MLNQKMHNDFFLMRIEKHTEMICFLHFLNETWPLMKNCSLRNFEVSLENWLRGNPFNERGEIMTTVD